MSMFVGVSVTLVLAGIAIMFVLSLMVAAKRGDEMMEKINEGR